MSMDISAILLASGFSSRMGKDKLLLTYCGKTFLQHAIDLISDLPFFQRILVTVPSRLEQLENMQALSDFQIIINKQPQLGQSESVRLGLEAANGSHFIFFPADQPLLTTADIRPYFDLAKSYNDKIIYPIIDNMPSSPTLFPARFRPDLSRITGDNGGSVVRNAYPESCYSFCPEFPKHFIDIDCMEDMGELV